MVIDAKTACQLRAAGIDPAKLPPGTKIGGNDIDAIQNAPKAKGPNKTESAWIRHLDWLVSIGKVSCYWYEPLRLRLTDPDPQTRRQTFYVPDFMAIMAPAWQLGDPRPRICEIKGGFVREDSSVKFRLAMAAYGKAFRFAMLQKRGMEWQTILGETWAD